MFGGQHRMGQLVDATGATAYHGFAKDRLPVRPLAARRSGARITGQFDDAADRTPSNDLSVLCDAGVSFAAPARGLSAERPTFRDTHKRLA